MIIALFSSKGGAGGSTVLSVMAHLLAARGKSVLVIDTAVDRSQDLYLNFSSTIVPDLQDLTLDELTARTDLGKPPIRLVNTDSLHEIDKLKIRQAAKIFDYLLIDGDPDQGNVFPAVLDLADQVLAVLTQDNASVRGADRILSSLDQAHLNKLSFMVNQYLQTTEDQLGTEADIFDIIEGSYAGHAAYDPSVRLGVNRGKPEEIDPRFLREVESIVKYLCSRQTANGTEPASAPITMEDEPFRDEPFRDVPVGEEPFREESFRDVPVGEEPFREESFEDEPSGEESIWDEPIEEESMGDEPSGDEPIGDEPFEKESVGEESIGDGPSDLAAPADGAGENSGIDRGEVLEPAGSGSEGILSKLRSLFKPR